jgi:TRAP-type mannitol/chloroaromatic compound transport system permease large subunit
MYIVIISILLFGSMFFLLAMGLPVAFVLGGLATVFTAFLLGAGIPFHNCCQDLCDDADHNPCCGSLVRSHGDGPGTFWSAEDLFEVMYRWIGSNKGGLAVGTVLACTLIAAMSGIASTGVVMMGGNCPSGNAQTWLRQENGTGCILAGGVLVH